MPTITKIEEQKNKKRVNIFVDDAFFCGLNKETAVIFRLKVGSEIEEQKLLTAVFESEVKRAFDKASEYLATRMHTKKELFDKLVKKGYEKPVIEKAIEKLEDYHYIDDKLFAKQFALQNSAYSKRMIENKLKQKGVAKDIVQETSELRDENEEYELCKKQAEKYAKSKDLSKENAVQKMYASLIRKGFSFDNVKKATNFVLKNQGMNELDDFD